jgi:hypothetical protein
MLDMGPDGGAGSGAGAAEIKANQNRISTLLSAPVSSQSSRPQSQIANGNGSGSPVVVGLPEGLNVEELLEDIKKLKATVRKQGRRIAKLEEKLAE